MKKPFVLGLWKINMKREHTAFTIVELLISITLLALVLMALYKSSDLMRASNLQLFNHLKKSNSTLKGATTLYKDLMYADHNITITTKDKFHRLTIENTSHSLYGLAQAKVVWLVYKENNTLLRIEGGVYSIPLKNNDRVEIDVIAKKLELFKIYRNMPKDKYLAIIKIANQDSQVIMAQNIPLAPPKEKKKPNNTPSPQNPPKKQ